MNATIPNSTDDIQAIVTDAQQIQIIGNGSKTGLSTGKPDVTTISLKGLNGITEYQPDEYTITAYAGTPVHELQAELKKHGQYLPFDPMLANSATIGGTVAANLAGSRRWRYGGVRDFILGATVIDGLGRVFRVGGKVVKNAAGFDLTKFMVGSLGLYAIMTEITFKVFPDMPQFTTLKLTYNTLDELLSAVYFLNQSVFELDALDFEPDGDGWALWARITGSEGTLSARVERITSTLKNKTKLQSTEEQHGDNTIWDTHNSLSWADHLDVVKIVVSPKQIPKFDPWLPADKRRYSVGGNVAWIGLSNQVLSPLETYLEDLDMTGIQILGQADGPIIGKPIDNVLSDRVKQILDPENKFV